MEILIKISENSYKATCNGCMLPPDVENVVNAIKNGKTLISWLSTFNTESATECFTAVQRLKESVINGKNDTKF